VALNAWRIAGAVIVLGGVALGLGRSARSGRPVGNTFSVALLAGAGTGFQQAVNGRVRAVAVSSISATFLNFAVGTAVLALVFLISVPFTGGPTAFPGTWWLWLGGIVGAFFIAIQVTTVSIIGVLGLGVSLVTGSTFRVHRLGGDDAGGNIGSSPRHRGGSTHHPRRFGDGDPVTQELVGLGVEL